MKQQFGDQKAIREELIDNLTTCEKLGKHEATVFLYTKRATGEELSNLPTVRKRLGVNEATIRHPGSGWRRLNKQFDDMRETGEERSINWTSRETRKV